MLYIKSCLNKLYKAEEKYSLIKQQVTKTTITYTYPNTASYSDPQYLFDETTDEEHYQFINICIKISIHHGYLPAIPIHSLLNAKLIIIQLYKAIKDLTALSTTLTYFAGICGQYISAYDIIAYYQIKSKQIPVNENPTIVRWMKWIDELLGVEYTL